MYTHRNSLILITFINTFILVEATRYVVTHTLANPQKNGLRQSSSVSRSISPSKVSKISEPISIETVTLTPRKTVLPPLPASNVGVKKTKPVESVPGKPVIQDVDSPKTLKYLLDNFNGATKKNTVGGFTGSFGGIGGFCLESVEKGKSNVLSTDGTILKLVYNVNNGFAGYYSKLNGLNLTKARRLTFIVKGSVGGEIFEVELGDGLNASKIDIREYLPYGASTTWQKVNIPLKAFAEVKNWKEMKGNFAIVFEQYLGSPSSSTLYIDTVQFE